jgi:hypothetical protein
MAQDGTDAHRCSEQMAREATIRRARAALALLLTPVVVGGLAFPAGGTSHSRPARIPDPNRQQRELAHFDPQQQSVPLALPPAAAPPDPAPAAVLSTPLRRHEVLGFAPYWTLDRSPGFDVRSLSTIAYFGVDIAGDGSLLQSGDGWTGYRSQALASLISRAHHAGDRVVLVAKCFDDASLHALVSDPQAPARLAAALAGAIRDRSMDGANLDLEGTGSADRAAFTRFVAAVAQALHGADPHWQVSVDTYAGSASNPDGFFDVAGFAPAVDALFVMAYDMYSSDTASPNAPLSGYSPNDTDSMAAYTARVPAGKLLLGLPFYGYDWQTTDGNAGARTVGSPTPMTYAAVVAAAHQPQWDSRGAVPWTAYQDDHQRWHQTWFDDPHSLAMKAQLVNQFRLRGVGAWALGMDGGDPAMMAALTGRSTPVKAPSSQLGSTPTPGPGSPAPGPSAPPPSRPTPSPTPSPSPSPAPPPGPPPPPPPPPPPTPPPLPTPPAVP